MEWNERNQELGRDREKKQSERKKHRHAFIKQNQKNADKDGEFRDNFFNGHRGYLDTKKSRYVYIQREREREREGITKTQTIIEIYAKTQKLIEGHKRRQTYIQRDIRREIQKERAT